MFCKYFPPHHSLFSHSLNCFFVEQKFLILLKSSDHFFSYMNYAFNVIPKKSSSIPMLPRFFFFFLFSESYGFLCLWSLWANLMNGLLFASRFYFYFIACGCPVVLAPFVEKAVLQHWILFVMCQRSVDYIFVVLFLDYSLPTLITVTL